MSVNVPLLRKAVEWVEEQVALPESERVWDQSEWCGTYMCVAGFIAVVEGWSPVAEYASHVQRFGEQRPASEVAEEALGLTDEQGDDLFLRTIDTTPELEAQNIRRLCENIAGERL